jgi:hypothetical protein
MSRTSPRVVPLTMSSLLHGRDANRSAGLPIRKMLNVDAAVDVAGAVAAAPLKMEPISDDISDQKFDFILFSFPFILCSLKVQSC